MFLLPRDEFTAKRKTVLEDGAAFLHDTVVQALADIGDDGWYQPIIDRALALYDQSYEDEAGQPGGVGGRTRLASDLAKALDRTSDPEKHTPDLLSRYVATASINAATEQAAADDPETLVLEWVSMRDDSVRTTHRAADGQTRPSGAPFHVGGAELRFPGDTSAPLEEWINCRCVVRPDASDSHSLVAAIPDTATGEVAFTKPAYEMGSPMTAPTETEAPVEKPPIQTPSEGVPWHGVLAPEGVYSGDGRKFAPGALRSRDLPMPLSWQKTSADSGHTGSVVVARMDGIAMVDGQARAYGQFLLSPEADEVVGQIADFGRMGVSVDVDDSSFELEEMDDEGGAMVMPKITFTDARICSASIVAIPAFQEAYVAIGTPPEGFMGKPMMEDETGEDPAEEQTETPAEEQDEKKKAMGGVVEGFGRGPGWLTDPKPTARIHAYWTEPGQPGYEKIGWGVGGDFNRCRVEVGEEIGEESPDKLRFINQICAQWHHDALGYWPSTHAKALKADGEPADSVSLVASARKILPAKWFTNPNLTGPTPITYSEEPEGTRVFGHLAQWGECHIGFTNTCTVAPHSYRNYADFLLGGVETEQGVVAVGQLTVGGGHARDGLSAMQARMHYDNVSTAVADVVVGEDQFGIWFSGWLREWTTAKQRHELLASKLSGDWRAVAGNLELVAAHGVNVPGFGVPRTSATVRNGHQVSLVAAGIVVDHTPAAFDLDELAAKVEAQLAARSQRRAARAALIERFDLDGKKARQQRAAALLSEYGSQ